MNCRLVVGGLTSYLPLPAKKPTVVGGPTEGAYCYSVWLRHLSLICRDVPGFRPRVVAEFGPGDSMGVGIAALLSVAQEYYCVDIVDHTSVATNERVLDELVQLFRTRTPIPDQTALPRLYPRLNSYEFPGGILDSEVLQGHLTDSFVNRIREAIRAQPGKQELVHYIWPWTRAAVPANSVDLVFTQVALQDMDHTRGRDDLYDNLEAMANWVRPGGLMSHQIDFSCAGGELWNHHWSYGSFTWKLIRGNRPYYKNRAPLSEYRRLLEKLGFEVVAMHPVLSEGLPRQKLSQPFRELSDDDLRTRAALVVAIKR